MKHEYQVVYHTIEDGWVMARVPELPGAVTQAPTVEEARERVRAAAQEVLRAYRENARLEAPQDAVWETLSLDVPEDFDGQPRHGELSMSRLPIPDETLSAFCRKHRIGKLSLFGSFLKGTARPDSDVDLLVEFEPDVRIGLMGMAGIESELSSLVGRKVDLRTAGDLSRYFREEVVSTAKVLYAG